MPRYGILRKIREILEKQVFLNREFDVNETIGIFGSKRSGTTWLLNLISEAYQSIPIFEPFQERWYPDAINFLPRPNEYQRGIDQYLTKIVSGKLKNTTPMYDFTWKTLVQRYKGKRLVIKFVRGNSVIPLFTSLGVKQAVYLIRNPYAVISSQIRTGIRPNLISHYVEGRLPLESLLALNWYADQQVPLQFEHEKIFKIKYEDLVADPERVLEPLFSKLGLNLENDLMKHIGKASRTTKRNTYRIDPGILNKWENELTEDQIVNIRDILERIDFEYNDLKYNYDSF